MNNCKPLPQASPNSYQPLAGLISFKGNLILHFSSKKGSQRHEALKQSCFKVVLIVFKICSRPQVKHFKMENVFLKGLSRPPQVQLSEMQGGLNCFLISCNVFLSGILEFVNGHLFRDSCFFKGSLELSFVSCQLQYGYASFKLSEALSFCPRSGLKAGLRLIT